MTDIVTSVTAAVGLTRQLVDLASIAKDAKAKAIVADLQLELAEVKIRLAELIEQNLQLKTELKNAKSQETDLKLRGDLYYKTDGDGPFCTCCYDSDRKLIRVIPLSAHFHVIAKFRCNVCEGKFQGE